MADTETGEQQLNIGDAVNRVVGLLARSRWYILGSAFLIPLAGMAVIQKLPDRFTSEATLVVVRPQIPQRYVEPLDPTTITAEFDALSREVLSQRRLIEIIEAFGLYLSDDPGITPAMRAEAMRRDVQIEPLGVRGARASSRQAETTAFRVTFTAATPRLAHDVTNRLTSVFIEEELKAQESQASVTTKFMAEQVAAAKKRLDAQEQRLSSFKMSNLGALPEQTQANLSALTDLRMQLQNVIAAQTRAQQQKSSLESTLSGLVARLQSEKGTLLTRYTPQHPEVIKKDKALQRASALLRRLQSGVSDEVLTNVDDPEIVNLRSQVEANLTEIAAAPKEEQRLRAEISQYQSRLNLTPVREQQLSAIMRDYELYRRDYSDLLAKQLGTQMSASVEEQQQGRQFRLVDPPTMPLVASSPKRGLLSLGAGAAGLIFGLLIAFVRDFFDRSFHLERDVKDRLNVRLVVGMPLLLTPAEERRRKWVRGAEWIAGTIMMMIVAAAELYVIQKG